MSNYTLQILEYQVVDGVKTKVRESRSNLGDALYLNNSLRLYATGREINLHNIHSDDLWEHPIICPGIPNKAWQSKNRILLTTNTEHFHAWGYLGPEIIIDLDAGIIIKEIKGSEGKPLSNGMFIIGLEGYGIFKSWLYNQDGEKVQKWNSYGHYVVDKLDNIRVIEQDRSIPTQSHVVKLHMDGSIEKGAKLTTYNASEPILMQNNDIIFENSGILRIIDSDVKEITRYQLLDIDHDRAWLFTSNIKLIGKNHLLVNIFERSDGNSSPITYKTHQWLLKLK
ncbi:hypothetical protein GCM10009430_22410 [Aquimarina litoralis]|uniref:Uncharacterized protein n=1 Tax=Aquimarina litoralis TaxID=584605 RepID=A0ABP3U463_9FLAO